MAEAGCGGATKTASSDSAPALAPAPAPAPAPPPAPPPTSGVPAIGHVALLVLENQREDKILANPSLPYLTSLAEQNAYASQYYANVHPSLGNYFYMTTGQVISNDLNFDGVVDVDNLIREINTAGKTWKAYLQSIPSQGYVGDGPYPYAKTHSPMSYFSDVRNDPNQAANLVPFEQLAMDISGGALPNFVYIAPDQLHNMHDCPPDIPNCDNDQKLAYSDAWVQSSLAALLNDPTFQQDGLLIVTWDESWDTDDDHGGGHVLTILAGSKVKPQYVSTTFYQHESLLRLIDDALQLPYEAGATTAPSMAEFFQGQ
jgi:phosphatidylinositol-3-phosphatase